MQCYEINSPLFLFRFLMSKKRNYTGGGTMENKKARKREKISNEIIARTI